MMLNMIDDRDVIKMMCKYIDKICRDFEEEKK